MKTWGDVFWAALDRGDDHGYAGYLADRWQERKAMQLFDRLRKCLELESEAHTLWDDAFSNVCHGKLSREMRDGYVEKTYKATRLHAEAQQALRDLAKELNQILDTGYQLD